MTAKLSTAVTTSLPARDLPPLLPADIEAIAEQTRATLADLLATDSLAAATVRSYASALRYWDGWHRATFGEPLPLLLMPRRMVSTESVCAFIAHHSPEPDGAGIRMAMPAQVRARMHQLGAIGLRLATRRAARVDGDVPTLATIRQRLAALSACHRLAGLTPDFADDDTVKRAMRALANRAARAAPAMLRKPKTAIGRDVLEAMLRDCLTDGLRGLRDAALLHVAFHAGGRRRSELAAMQWPDLLPLTLPESIQGVRDGYAWTLHHVKGKRRESVDAGVLTAPILGVAADALDRWRDVVLASDKPADGPVWYRLVTAPEGKGWVLSTPLIGADVWHILRARVEALGLDPNQFGAHSLRSGAVTTFLREGGSLGDAAGLLAHAKLETTRTHYDQRGVPVEALARLLSRHKG